MIFRKLLERKYVENLPNEKVRNKRTRDIIMESTLNEIVSDAKNRSFALLQSHLEKFL